jgi:hypothetical protein
MSIQHTTTVTTYICTYPRPLHVPSGARRGCLDRISMPPLAFLHGTFTTVFVLF